MNSSIRPALAVFAVLALTRLSPSSLMPLFVAGLLLAVLLLAFWGVGAGIARYKRSMRAARKAQQRHARRVRILRCWAKFSLPPATGSRGTGTSQ